MAFKNTSLAFCAMLAPVPAWGVEYSNNWILPAYAAGQTHHLNIDDTLTPPILTFYPPMPGWCYGNTAKIGPAQAYALNEPPQPPVVFLNNEALNKKISPEFVKICLSGYSSLPLEHDNRSVQVLNVVNAQAGDVKALQSEMAKLANTLQSLQSAVDSLRGEVSAVLQQSQQLQANLLRSQNDLRQALQALQASNDKIAKLESENSDLRNQLGH
jgi:hypothetical protein